METNKKIKRLIDANLNRCREGLRVVEDILRFVLNDEVLYKKVRKLRHNVDAVLRDYYEDLIKTRDIAKDCGRTILEAEKKTLLGIIAANLKRVQESLRSLEECSKIFLPKASQDFKKQRYTTYNLEQDFFKLYKPDNK
ncbi:MAG: thiamine-phosphate pyrophosphorylase [Elusimicrobiota bacterium]|jgi:thiamine-phosphate pyrophosphorylase|nr:thiamine-phosphate pyrophosphorylase [Elusimicrobiota bacterium]